MRASLRASGSALACLLMGLLSCTTPPQPTAPRAAIDRFLEFYFKEYGSGLPDAAQRRTLRPLLTDDLNEALADAAEAERCDKNRTQGQEPPLVQGDIFSSLFEKATATTGIDQGAAAGQQLTYRLRFEWREPGAATASVQWTDEVLLRSIEGRWLIDDFIHGGDWQFSVPGSMKRMLRDVARLCVSP